MRWNVVARARMTLGVALLGSAGSWLQRQVVDGAVEFSKRTLLGPRVRSCVVLLMAKKSERASAGRCASARPPWMTAYPIPEPVVSVTALLSCRRATASGVSPSGIGQRKMAFQEGAT